MYNKGTKINALKRQGQGPSKEKGKGKLISNEKDK
jgi:hypothetical protein